MDFVGMGFTQQELLQETLAETQDGGESRQDQQGEGHDPGHAVVLVVAAVAVGVVVVPVSAVPLLLRHGLDMAGHLPVSPGFGEEHHEDHPEGIVGREEGPEETQDQPDLVVQLRQGPQDRPPC